MLQCTKKSKDDYVKMQRRRNNTKIQLFDLFFFDFLKMVNKCCNIFFKNVNICVSFIKSIQGVTNFVREVSKPPAGPSIRAPGILVFDIHARPFLFDHNRWAHSSIFVYCHTWLDLESWQSVCMKESQSGIILMKLPASCTPSYSNRRNGPHVLKFWRYMKGVLWVIGDCLNGVLRLTQKL